MGETDFSTEVGTSVLATFAMAGPLLALAAVIGLVIAVLQAATQIQEQTIAQVVKIFVIGVVLVVFGRVLAAPLLEHSIHVFNDFPTMVR